MAQAERRVVIERRGRQVAVTLDDYRKKAIDDAGHTYQQLGWRIVSWEDGEPYRPPSERRETEVADESAPPRAERPARVSREGGSR